MAVRDEQPVEPAILLPLGDIPMPKRSRAVRTAAASMGHKAVAMVQLFEAAAPLPATWVLDGRSFDAFVQRCLPRKHDLRALIRLAGTSDGEERCARAYDRVRAEPLPDAVVASIEQLWDSMGAQLPLGVSIRPSLIADGETSRALLRHVSAINGVVGVDAISSAIREIWANSVLACSVADYAAAGLREVSMALLVQQTVSATLTGVLMRPPKTGPQDGPSVSPPHDPGWLLGTTGRLERERHWARHSCWLHPVPAQTAGADRADEPQPQGPRDGEDEISPTASPSPPRSELPAPTPQPSPPDPWLRLRDALGPQGWAQLVELGATVEERLGDGVELRFAVEPRDQGTPQLWLLSTTRRSSPGARAKPTRGGVWTEVGLGMMGGEPPAALSASLHQPLMRRVLQASLASLRCKLDSDADLLRCSDGYSYLNLVPLARAAASAPAQGAHGLLSAIGGADQQTLAELAADTTEHARSSWKAPFVGVASLLAQLRLEHEATQVERAMESEAQPLAELDLSLVPYDGLGTTLAKARRLLDRATGLWTRWLGAQLVMQLTISALIRRRVPEAPITVGTTLTSGVGGLYGASLGLALGRVAEEARQDPAALSLIRSGTAHTLHQLPDGRARGALGQFLSRYGEMTLGAFELGRPRWREDASEPLGMLAVLAQCAPLPTSVDGPVARARAAAAQELARYEPYLSTMERRMVFNLLDRCKTLMSRRLNVDRWLLRSLGTLRHVLLDVDRRLRRIEPLIPPGGAFHCPVDRLVSALASGRPELAQLIEMRRVQRQLQSRGTLPPPRSAGRFPPPVEPLRRSAELKGIGVSGGVVEGRAVVLDGELPRHLAGGEVLVTRHADPGLSPLYALAGGLVCETGGTLAPAAEIAREYGVVAVMSARDATGQLQTGDSVRVDGVAGTVQRLDSNTAPEPTAPPSRQR